MSQRDQLLRIVGDGLVVDVDAVNGGRVAQVEAGGVPLLIGRDDTAATAMNWGAFPMVPWAGRIRDGRFTLSGDDYQLVRNMGDHAIHGVGYVSEWVVTARTERTVELLLDLPTDETWPFGGRARQRFAVDGSTLTSSLSVTAAEQAFPVSLGWHPWFRKPDRVAFRPESMYRRDEHHIAVDELVEVVDDPWDDCFVNRQPVELTIDDVLVVLRSPCTHWVVYDMPAHATCIEPQTGPPDAFNIAPKVVEPRATITASYQLTVPAR